MSRSLTAGLEWWSARPGGAAWLAALPRLAEECAQRWGLELGAPYAPARIACVVPARRADGTAAVLKLSFAGDRDGAHEGAALAAWAGAGAARLLAHDAARGALLLERCVPGTPLLAAAGDDDETLRVLAALLPRLWRSPADGHPFARLADRAAQWSAAIPEAWQRLGRPFERALLEQALEHLGRLPATQPEQVLLHQDLHAGNVLRARREPWLAIDPKPLVGERAFDLASALRDRRPALAADPHPARRVRHRLDALSEALAVDRERARGWGLVHALAWGWEDGGWLPEHVAVARWLAEAA